MLYKEKSPHYIHLSITSRCNARCKGCVNSIAAQGVKASFKDTNPIRDAKAIHKLIRLSKEKDIVICLYGGEPLLQPQKISDLMDELKKNNGHINLKYMLYTNADLLGNAISSFPQVINRLWLTSVSIDGMQKQHARVRRGSDLLRIEKNLVEFKKHNKEKVLMWSTLREDQSLDSCFKEFLKLYKIGTVDLFFWHWIETQKSFTDLKGYAKRYEMALHKIMKSYCKALQSGEILPITHINELILYILTGKKRETTSCGVETPGNYDIVDGKIYACADLPNDLVIGSIDKDGNPSLKKIDLKFLINYKKELNCETCDVGFYCGGRCPVQAFTKGKTRLLQYCQLMHLHVRIIKEYIPKIKGLFKKNNVQLQSIYDNIVFYNQFTDVTP